MELTRLARLARGNGMFDATCNLGNSRTEARMTWVLTNSLKLHKASKTTLKPDLPAFPFRFPALSSWFVASFPSPLQEVARQLFLAVFALPWRCHHFYQRSHGEKCACYVRRWQRLLARILSCVTSSQTRSKVTSKAMISLDLWLWTSFGGSYKWSSSSPSRSSCLSHSESCPKLTFCQSDLYIKFEVWLKDL